MADTPDTSRTEEFLAHYSSDQRKIYAFIRALLFYPSDADEVFQETCIALWRDFDRFEVGTDFLVWAKQIARHRVLAHGSRIQTERRRFSDSLVEILADDVVEISELLIERQENLAKCMQKLQQADQQLIRQRYLGTNTIAEIAEESGTPVSTLYKRLGRIRQNLIACVDRVTGSAEQAY